MYGSYTPEVRSSASSLRFHKRKLQMLEVSRLATYRTRTARCYNRSMKEKTLESAIKKWLELRGYYVKKINSGAAQKNYNGKQYWIRLGEEGSPDLICCIGGLFVGIEVKKDKQELERWERQWQRYEQTMIAVKSSRRSIAQHLERGRLLKAGGVHLACADFEGLQRQILRIEEHLKTNSALFNNQLLTHKGI